MTVCDVSTHFPNEGYSRSRGFRNEHNADVEKWLVLLNTHPPPPCPWSTSLKSAFLFSLRLARQSPRPLIVAPNSEPTTFTSVELVRYWGSDSACVCSFTLPRRSCPLTGLRRYSATIERQPVAPAQTVGAHSAGHRSISRRTCSVS